MPPTIGTNVLGRKVLYLPSFFTYAKYIVQVDGKIGLFRGLSPRLMSNALSTVTRGSMKKVFPPDEIEQVSNKDDMKTSLKKVVKETSYEMMMQCVSRMLAHPLHVISMRCMVQFVGREAKYSGVLSSIGKIFKEEGLLGFFVYVSLYAPFLAMGMALLTGSFSTSQAAAAGLRLTTGLCPSPSSCAHLLRAP